MKGDSMNQDPAYQKWQELGWRRPLTAAEQAELRAWLVAHPEAQAEAETELLLSATLAKLPDAPVPSNFTARVLQAIETEAAAANQTAPPKASWWGRVFLPRFAVAAVLVLSGTLAYRQHLKHQQGELAVVANDLVAAQSLSDPAVLADFEVIASLNPSTAVADEQLLDLSEDLLALGQ
jgi:anti-sigma factor RsiW